MQHSPALVDADLLPLVRSAPVDDLVCLAQREKLSPRLADALLTRGFGEVDLVVLRRGELALSAERLRDKAVVSGEIPAIRGALLARAELPADVRLALVQAAGRAIAGLRIVKGAIAPERLVRLLRNAEDAALATIGEGASQGEETGGFARHVIATGRLNTRILMHAMVHGQAMFFAACCATLSQLPQRKVFAVLGSGSRTALNALFVRCGLEPGVRNLFARLIEYARSVNLADDLAARHYVVNALTEDLLAEHDGGGAGRAGGGLRLSRRAERGARAQGGEGRAGELCRGAAGSGAGAAAGRADGLAGRLVPELLDQHAFLEAGAGVEEQGDARGVVLAHHDIDDILELDIVGYGADRALVALAHVESHGGVVVEDSAAPAAGGGRARSA
jgi:uncharacterized protein (DUF2336 family)